MSTRHRGDRLGRLEGALQIARVEAGERLTDQAAAQPLSLPAALIGKGRVGLALDAVLEVPGGLAVADEKQARRPDFWGRRSGPDGVRLLRARGSDLDIYTNFL
jgi:hypothetical protein